MVGAFAVAALHYSYEHDAVRSAPASTHLGHNCRVIPEEERFITKELIERSCLVGTADDLRGRVAELDEAGLDQIVLLPPLDAKDDVIASVARELIAGSRRGGANA